ncbi:hypothetical protein LBC_09600 [Campylobacter sp. 19-13652]|nr:hypothetical protein LBC_09600 [Campylobacter sp. 19-13652]
MQAYHTKDAKNEPNAAYLAGNGSLADIRYVAKNMAHITKYGNIERMLIQLVYSLELKISCAFDDR